MILPLQGEIFAKAEWVNAMILQQNFDDLGLVTTWLEGLQRRYAERMRVRNKKDTWGPIAHDAKLSVGTIEGICRDRVKGVSTKVYRKIQDLVVRDLTSHITGLELELEIARSARLGVDPSSFATAEAALANAREALRTVH
jgi:hypothetical protein